MSYTTIGFLFGDMRCVQCGEPVVTSAHVCTDWAKLQKTIAEAKASALAARRIDA